MVLAVLLCLWAVAPALAGGGSKTIFAYLYMGPNENSETAAARFKTQVQATGGRVDIVAPSWLNITNAAGDIKDLTSQDFVDWAHSNGIRVVPMVSKDFNSNYIQMILGSPAARTKLADDLMAKVDQYGYDGLNIDIEGAGLDQPGVFTAFAQDLAAKLHKKGKLASVAVMTKTGPNTPSWLGEYDYPILGSIMDYVIVMAYDQHWETSEPGPVAGLDWVTATMNYAVTAVAPEKLLLGVPFYGRNWKNGTSGGGISYNYAEELLNSSSAPLQWDDTAKTPYFTFIDSTGVKHDVWFDNAQSLAYKMQLADQLNLGGAAFWRLGFEDTAWWADLDLQLQGYNEPQQPPATDPNASDPANTDPTTPTDPGTPADPTPDPSQGNANLKDIKGHWAQADIEELVGEKVITGFPDGTFRPELPVTREQFVLMLNRALKLPDPEKKSGLADIPAGYKYASEIYAAKEAGIIHGYEDDTFRPNQTATRAEIAQMLAVALKLSIDSKPVQLFKDVPAGYWAAGSIQALSKAGISNGTGNGYYSPKAKTTRAQVARFLNQALKK